MVLIAIEVNYIQENTARAERQDMGLDLRELKAHSDTDEKWITFTGPELIPKPQERRELAGVFEDLELVDPGLNPELKDNIIPRGIRIEYHLDHLVIRNTSNYPLSLVVASQPVAGELRGT